MVRRKVRRKAGRVEIEEACAINRREIPRLRKPTIPQERKSVGLLRSE
jgi:hypothetical protein